MSDPKNTAKKSPEERLAEIDAELIEVSNEIEHMNKVIEYCENDTVFMPIGYDSVTVKEAAALIPGKKKEIQDLQVEIDKFENRPFYQKIYDAWHNSIFNPFTTAGPYSQTEAKAAQLYSQQNRLENFVKFYDKYQSVQELPGYRERLETANKRSSELNAEVSQLKKQVSDADSGAHTPSPLAGSNKPATPEKNTTQQPSKPTVQASNINLTSISATADAKSVPVNAASSTKQKVSQQDPEENQTNTLK